MKIRVEFKRLDSGPYGWMAEVPSMIGVREYGPTKEAVRQAIIEHIRAEKHLLKRNA